MSLRVLILAAGASTRLGKPKATLSFPKEPLINRSISLGLELSGQSPIVVTGGHHEDITHACRGLDCHIVHNPQWVTGIGASIRAGLKEVPCGEDALIILADQYRLNLAGMRAFKGRQRLTFACAEQVIGPPVLVPAAMQASICQDIADDCGIKAWALAHGVAFSTLDMPEAKWDIDTLKDYETGLRWCSDDRTDGKRIGPQGRCT